MDETINKWLQRLAFEPIMRDGNRHGIPFHVATEMMEAGLIEPGIESAVALAKTTWRVWNITPAGLQRLWPEAPIAPGGRSLPREE